MQEQVTTIDNHKVRCVKFSDQREVRETCRKTSRDWQQSLLGIGREAAYKYFEAGNLDMVPPSDEMIARLEDKFEFCTSKYKTFDSVAGGVPNVPAMLANQPLNMRVRRRAADERGPLTICIDLTSSASIGPEYLVKRGSAILALSRIISSTRPVTIWVGAGLSEGRGTSGVTAWFQLDAAPLDLARAAFQMSSAGVPRGMIYPYLNEVWGAGGGWPLRHADTWRRMAPKYLAQWFEGEILFVPPVFEQDEFKDPAKWLEGMLKQYGMRGEE